MRQLNYILTILTLVLLLTGCYRNNYRINGKIENGKGKSLVLEKMQLDRNLPVDSVELKKNGSF
jgi:hypothetical protein